MGKFGEDEGGLEGEGTPSERGSLLPPRSSPLPPRSFPNFAKKNLDKKKGVWYNRGKMDIYHGKVTENGKNASETNCKNCAVSPAPDPCGSPACSPRIRGGKRNGERRAVLVHANRHDSNHSGSRSPRCRFGLPRAGTAGAEKRRKANRYPVEPQPARNADAGRRTENLCGSR